MLLPLMTLAAVFAFLSVNNADVVAFRYLFIAFTCLQSAFVVVAYIILSKEVCDNCAAVPLVICCPLSFSFSLAVVACLLLVVVLRTEVISNFDLCYL